MTDLRSHYEAHGQGHVFAHFDSLSATEQQALLDQATAIDLAEVASLHQSLVKDDGGKNESLLEGLEPADYLPLPGHREDANASLWREAVLKGEGALRTGRVAAFTVAGGQGTRLGFRLVAADFTLDLFIEVLDSHADAVESEFAQESHLLGRGAEERE